MFVSVKLVASAVALSLVLMATLGSAAPADSTSSPVADKQKQLDEVDELDEIDELDELDRPRPADDILGAAQDDSMYLAGIECASNEHLAQGYLPTCEPTCENPRPVCPKIFFYDFVPCFCNAPLVRNTTTKRCVELSSCA